MYVRRKVFSKVENQETGEIKLFSINEIELSDSEKLYSVLMDEDEISLFSDFLEEYQKEFGDSKDTKLKLSDRMAIGSYKHLYGKNARKRERNRIDGVDESGKAAKQGAIGGGIAGALVGTALHGNKKAAAIYAGTGAASAAAGAYIGTKAGLATRKALEKKMPKYKASWDKQRDRLDVAEGKMSKEDYAKKHYTKK